MQKAIVLKFKEFDDIFVIKLDTVLDEAKFECLFQHKLWSRSFIINNLDISVSDNKHQKFKIEFVYKTTNLVIKNE